MRSLREIEFIKVGSEIEMVNIVGINSTYVFYLGKENKKIQITPINGIVKSMENNQWK